MEISLKTSKPWSPTTPGQVGHVHGHVKMFWDQGRFLGTGMLWLRPSDVQGRSIPPSSPLKSAELELSLPSPPSQLCHRATKMSPPWCPPKAGQTKEEGFQKRKPSPINYSSAPAAKIFSQCSKPAETPFVLISGC